MHEWQREESESVLKPLGQKPVSPVAQSDDPSASFVQDQKPCERVSSSWNLEITATLAEHWHGNFVSQHAQQALPWPTSDSLPHSPRTWISTLLICVRSLRWALP